MNNKNIGDIDITNKDNRKILKDVYGYYKTESLQELIDSVEVRSIIYK